MSFPSKSDEKRSVYHPISVFLRLLGPGVIAGAADDDPSGIATYSQAGAQFGFQQLWSVVLTFPFMVAIQLVAARIGRVTGKGVIANARLIYPEWVVISLVALVVIANTINIAADLAAMGSAITLIIGGPTPIYALLFGIFCAVTEVVIPYRRYSHVLKWLTLVLFVYVAAVFTIHIEWIKALSAVIKPTFEIDTDYLLTIVAVFGTTISPYVFFWQTAQEVEDMQLMREHPLFTQATDTRHHLRRMAVDTGVGMAFSNGIAFCIMITTAATLHQAGLTTIATAAQAAEALRPLAGPLTFALFSLGIIGTGLLAVPVLAGSARLLRRHRRCNLDRRRVGVHGHRPDQDAVLGRGDQWLRRRASDGGDDDHGKSHRAYGPIPLRPWRGPCGLGGDRIDGHCSGIFAVVGFCLRAAVGIR